MHAAAKVQAIPNLKASLSNWLSSVRNMLTSFVTYCLVDDKLRDTKDLDIPYTRAQCVFQAINQSKVLSSIVCKFSVTVLANNSPAICSCGADQNCPNSSVSTRSPSSIKEQSLWEGFVPGLQTTTEFQECTCNSAQRIKFVANPSLWLLATSSRKLKLLMFAGSEPTPVAKI